ncbi:hypothetical protein GCM10011591_38160 [Nocardia camponoti]|uniref:Uncharacterized protein n=1 Tax=Nocardia camponoti TaxID=1616106 RepID=A0A917QQN1_9NOCA|nr:hypothetical protein [Nocardia camponoti]GGK62321.1 hypothetical protein GCM10011591_38160 [Nocardia camponoti]
MDQLDAPGPQGHLEMGREQFRTQNALQIREEVEVVDTGDIKLLALTVPMRAAFGVNLAGSVEDELFNPCEETGR